MRDLLPDDVRRAIGRHLIRSGHNAEDGFSSNEEDEDSLTGDLLRAVRRGWSAAIVADGAAWRWRVTTRKFRGRGELATEHIIGADGIVQIEVTTPSGSTVAKGLLFQAKNQWIHRDQDLLIQVRHMEEFAPSGSAVFDYSAEGYRGFPSSIVIERDARPRHIPPRRLGEFLADEFLECSVGRRDTYYDWSRKRLILSGRSMEPFTLHPRFLIAVQAESRSAKPE